MIDEDGLTDQEVDLARAAVVLPREPEVDIPMTFSDATQQFMDDVAKPKSLFSRAAAALLRWAGII